MSDISRLEELAAKYKQKKKFNQEESFKAEEYLENLLQNSSHRTAAYGFMLSLPSDVVARTFLKVWLDSDPACREELITELINMKKFDGEAAYNRLTEIIKELVETSGSAAVRLFAFLCEKLTKSCKDAPANKYVTKINKTLVETGLLLKTSPDESLTACGKVSVAVLIMYALVSKNDGEPYDTGFIESYINWLNKFDNRFVIPGKIRETLEKSTAKWPVELQKRCCDIGLITVVTTHLKAAEKPAVLKENNKFSLKQPEKRKPAEKHLLNKASERKDGGQKQILQKENFDPLHNLNQLRDYIIQLQETDKRHQKQINDALAEADKERYMRAKAEKELAEIRSTGIELKAENEKLKAEALQARNIITNLEKQLYDEKLKYENDRNRLLDMLEVRAKQQLEQFKNKLLRKLRTDYLDYKQAEYEHMTVDLGENLRIQLGNVFNTLCEEGIEFKGGGER